VQHFKEKRIKKKILKKKLIN